MNKVNKKQDSNDKEKFEPYKSLGLKYRFA